MANFTFKKQPQETGLSAIANPYPNVDIKLNKNIVGYIASPNYSTEGKLWSIRFSVIFEEDKIGWKWITLKFKGKSEQECRDFLNKNAELIQAKYSFKVFD